MKIDVEVNSLDLRYERQRMRSASRERQLLLSIMETGITDPLHGVSLPTGEKILLDGFKRLRCARKISLQIVPFLSLGEDEATAIINMLRLTAKNEMSQFEQAIFVEELKSAHGLSIAEIAMRLRKSKAWVRVRLQSLTEMSEAVKAAILSGKFPLWSYLYTLHPYTRVPGGASKSDIDEFVRLVSGKAFSVREIERLVEAFFRGGEAMREQLRKGDLGWCLEEMKRRQQDIATLEMSETEQRCVRDLEIVNGSMGRLSLKLPGLEIMKPEFIARADLLAEQALNRVGLFNQVLRGFYDRCRKKESNTFAP